MSHQIVAQVGNTGISTNPQVWQSLHPRQQQSVILNVLKKKIKKSNQAAGEYKFGVFALSILGTGTLAGLAVAGIAGISVGLLPSVFCVAVGISGIALGGKCLKKMQDKKKEAVANEQNLANYKRQLNFAQKITQPALDALKGITEEFNARDIPTDGTIPACRTSLFKTESGGMEFWIFDGEKTLSHFEWRKGGYSGQSKSIAAEDALDVLSGKETTLRAKNLRMDKPEQFSEHISFRGFFKAAYIGDVLAARITVETKEARETPPLPKIKKQKWTPPGSKA